MLFSGLSDHCPILLNIELKQSKIAAQNKCIERINYENLSRSLGQENWNNIIDSKDVDHCAELIVSKIRNHIERAREKVYIKCKDRKLKPWITQGLIKSIRERDRLKKISTILKTREAHNNFVQYRDRLSTLIRLIKNDYFTKKLQNTKK